MKKFFIKWFCFSLPFLIFFATVLIVDPYNFFGIFNAVSIETKRKISYPINYALWKTISFRQNPLPNILLGDSRMGAINEDMIYRVTGENYFNFSYGGGTIAEACKTFWEAMNKTELKNVYIGINFNNYNANNSSDRVSGAIEVVNNPLLYLINRDVLRATFAILKNEYFPHENIDVEKPPMSRDSFWDYQLNNTTRRFYTNYKYPTKMKAELERIAEFCRRKKIKLFFVILPTHVSLQKKIQNFGLIDSHKVFLSDLKQLGTVYDFDYPNELTSQRRNFKDPYHLKQDKILPLIQRIWKNK